MVKLLRVLLGTGRTVVAVLLVLAVAAWVFAFSLGAVYEDSLYTDVVNTESFADHLYENAQDVLQDEALFYGLPYEVLSPTVTKDALVAVVKNRLSGVVNTFKTGEAPPAITWEKTALETAIAAHFESLPFEDRPLDSDAASTIAGEIAEVVENTLYIGLADKTLKLGTSVLGEGKPLYRVISNAWWLLIAAALLTALSLIGRDIQTRFYRTAGTLFIGSAVAAVPTWLFIGYDFPSRLPIGDSALGEWVDAVVYGLLGRVNTTASVVFTVCTVLLVGSIVWLLIQNKKTARWGALR